MPFAWICLAEDVNVEPGRLNCHLRVADEPVEHFVFNFGVELLLESVQKEEY